MPNFIVICNFSSRNTGIKTLSNLVDQEGIRISLNFDKNLECNIYLVKSEELNENKTFSSELLTIHYIASFSKNFCVEKNVEGWNKVVTNFEDNEKSLSALENFLSLKTFFSGHSLSSVDLAMLSILKPNPSYPNILRWNRFVSHLHGLNKVSQKANTANVRKSQVDNSYRSKLKGAVEGNVVTRFPPEPSGYLHIGHAKAALLNHYYARMYSGKFILRFDDTNPVKESKEFEEAIKKDLESLGIKPDFVTYSSDHFEELQNYAIELIKLGLAYCDDTPVEVIREERAQGIESVRRNQDVDANLQFFEAMVMGTKVGETFCLRAKIDMNAKNKCMRDPVLFRCVTKALHHRFGDKYKAYPTYDFACPIIDSIEGVTHALRTNEYSDRIEQYNWVISVLKLRPVNIYEFSRLNFVRTVMSKTKLNWFVTNKVVDGWNDPRMPTVSGILRRGLTVEALMEFILDQGPTKAGNCMEWDKLWAKNKQLLDPIVPRYSAVELPAVKVNLDLEDITEKTRPLHPKNPDLGECKQYLTPTIWLDRPDVSNHEEEVTLMRWGNALIFGNESDNVVKGKLNLQGDFKSTKKKLHWVPDLPEKVCKLVLREYGHLLKVNKLSEEAEKSPKQFENEVERDSLVEKQAIGEPEMVNLTIGDKIQLERKGYFNVLDKIDDKIVLVKIPDGKASK